ncbi:MAG: hypothetical protein FH761_07115 [Firmicutes bacterium]|nr:hypothetical protein [Bacillota bacterium]
MNSNKRLMIIYIFIIILIGIFAISIYRYPRSFLKYGVSILGWILFVGKIIYDRWDKFYFFIQQCIYLILNDNTKWDFSAEFKGTFDEHSIEKILEEVNKSYEGIRVIQQTNKSIELKVNDFRIELNFENNNCSPYNTLANQLNSLTMYILDYRVTFRKSLETLNNKLEPLVNIVEKSLGVKESHYFLDVYFEKPNPYFGVYLRNLSLEEIYAFNVTIIMNNDKTIKVSKEKLMLNTTSIGKLIALSNKYLTLSKY